MSNEMACVLAIDVGGTKLACVVVDETGRVCGGAQVPTDPEDSPTDLIKRLTGLVHAGMANASVGWSGVLAVGIGVPGTMEPEAGVVLQAPNLPALNGLALVQVLQNEWSRPVFLENDANAAAMGELLFGAGRGVKHLVYVTVSTGIGGGLVLDGRLYRGRGSAGEVGHMLVVRDGRQCGCGRYGCVEAYASGPAIARSAQEALATGATSMLRDLAALNGGTVTTAHVAQAAAAGDTLARSVWMEAMTHLGHCIGDLINLLNPDRVLVGGGVASAGRLLLEPVRAAAEKRIMPELVGQADIVLAQLGAASGTMGAAAVAWTGYRQTGV